MRSGLSPDQKNRPYFYTQQALVLPLALSDVTEDSKKRPTAEALMSPVNVSVDIPDTLRDNYFTKKLFADPVITVEGDTYEREKIATWLIDHHTNPLDKKEMDSKQLLLNKTKLQEVNQFLDKHPVLRDSNELYLPHGWVKELEQACVESKLDLIKHWCDRDRRLGSWTFNFEEKEYEAYRGKTMLHLACTRGTIEAVSHLLTLEEKRAEGLGLLLLLKKDNSDKLPIHYTMTPDRDPRIMRQLAAQMGQHLVDVAPVNLTTKAGEKQRQMTALHLAAMNNDVAILTTLLERKADLSVKDSQGNTALHAAVVCGARDAVALLIKAGASAEVENDTHQTPEMSGATCEQVAAVETLKKRTAELAQQQQSQLQQAGPVGLALLQMQQVMMHLQSLIKNQAAEIKELRGTIAEQDQIIKQQQVEQIERLSEGVIAAIRGQKLKSVHIQRELKQLIQQAENADTWQSMAYVPTPQILRKTVMSELASHPMAQKMEMILWDHKEEKKLAYAKKRAVKSVVSVEGLGILASVPKIVIATNNGPYLVLKVCNLNMDKYSSINMPFPGDISSSYRGHYQYKISKMLVSPTEKVAIISTYRSAEIRSSPCTIINIWDSHKETMLGHYSYGYDQAISDLTFLADGRLAIGYIKEQRGNVVQLFELTEHELKYSPLRGELKECKQPVGQLRALPNGSLVTFHNDLTVRVWNLLNGACSATFSIEAPPLSCCQTLSNHHIAIVSGKTPREVHVLDLIKQRIVAKLVHESSVSVLAALPNNYLASASHSKITIWDTITGVKLTEFLSKNSVTSLAASPNGQLISGTCDGVIEVWQPQNFSLVLNVGFRLLLLEADPQFITQEDGIQIKTSLPCEAELKALTTVLQTVCPDHKLTMTVTPTLLTIAGVNPELRADLEGLCQALSIPKVAPGARAASGLAAFMSRPGGLYAPMPSPALPGGPAPAVAAVVGASSSSSSSSYSSSSSSSSRYSAPSPLK